MKTRCVFYALLALMGLHIWFFVALADKTLAGYTDFSAFYAAGRIAAEGKAGDLYNYETQKRVQDPLFAGVQRDGYGIPVPGPMLYYHPPFEVPVFRLLAYLSYPWAFGVWALASVAVLLIIPLVLRAHVAGLWRASPHFVALSCVAFFPAFIAVLQGQDSILLALLFALAWVSLKQGREAAAGGLLALGLFKFHFVLPVVVLFLLRRRWRMLAGFSIASVLLLAVSFLVVGVKGIMEYPGFLLELNSGLQSRVLQALRGIFPFAMPNLRGVLFMALSGFLPESLVTPATLVASAALLLWWGRRSARLSAQARALDLVFSLDICVAVLVSFHAQLHDLTLLALPIVLVLNRALEDKAPGWLRWGVGLLAALFFFTPAYVPLLQRGWQFLLVIPISLLALAAGRQLRPNAAQPAPEPYALLAGHMTPAADA